MKNMKKVLALLVAVLMIAASMSALAENHTISLAEGSTHTYEIFQIFTGTVVEGQLTSMKYGVNAVGTTGDAVSQEDMTTLSGLTDNARADDQVDITNILPFVNLDSTPVATISGTQTYSAPVGYYLIRDAAGSPTNDETQTLYLISVINADTVISPKADKPSSEKKVQDINDSDTTPALSGLQDTADWDIGDQVPYTLTATLPSNYGDYKEYYLQFVDDMSKGLSLDTDSVRIYFGEGDTTGTAIEFTAVPGTEYENGQKYTYTIDNLKAAAYASYNLAAGSVIKITYTATLDTDAVITDAGNPNKYKIVYSSNPNHSGEGTPTKETPWDINIVFTYKTVFDKVDEDGNALTGADFKLEKWVNGAWVEVTALHTGAGAKNPSKTTNATEAVGEEGDPEYVPAQEATQFTFSGLDDGKYKLTETETPDGYNTIDPVEFTITAAHNVIITGGGSQLTELTGTAGTSFTLTSVKIEGELDANVVNKSGATLPSTGGIGTTIFYVGGSILVLAAVILLVTKRRMNAEK